jgi:diketogulonate reductase-like aldo/keto reductase
MRTVSLYDGARLPVMGLGTWAMGGESQPDYSQDERALAAITAALEMGYTHIDTAEMYAAGHTEELVGKAIRPFDRQTLFITSKVQPHNLAYADVHRSLDGSLKRLGVDYVDLYLIHWPGKLPLTDTFDALNETVRDGRVRFLGVSNFDLRLLRRAEQLSQTPIVTNQVPYSVATRTYVTNGVLHYCQQQEIVLTAYSPVEQGGLAVAQTLEEVAGELDVTPYQVAIAWLLNQPWVVTIPMSHNPQHLQQNLDAAEITLSESQMTRLNALDPA